MRNFTKVVIVLYLWMLGMVTMLWLHHLIWLMSVTINGILIFSLALVLGRYEERLRAWLKK
jgi:hypothetical protein